MRHAPPDWLENAVFYQIYPQSFQDSNGDGIGDLPGVIERLDYLESLGVTAIWLNPIFDSPFWDAGYDVRDYFKIAERYGTEEDLKRLFQEAHARGIKVLLDLVAGHTSLECEWFRKSSEFEKNRFSNYYMWTDGWWDNQRGFRFISGYPSGRDGYYMINFFFCQPALNYGFVDPVPGCSWQIPTDHPDARAVREEMRRVMKHYLDMGCDGFRVDMASSLVRANNPSLRQQGLTELWQDYRNWMKSNYPDAALVAEWSDPANAVSAGFDLDFFLSFHKPGYDSLFRKGDKSYFSDSGKGDVGIFLKEMDAQLKLLSGLDGYFSIVSGNHDTSRVRQGRTLEEMKTVFVFLLTAPGVPFLYYGDEIGMDYVKGLPNKEGSYNRNGSRTPMQWEPGEHAGFSSASPKDFYLPIDPSPARPSVSEQEKDPESLLTCVRRLIRLRREMPELGAKGSFAVLTKKGGGYPLVYRRELNGRACVTAINPRGKEAEADVKTDAALAPLFRCGESAWTQKDGVLHLKLGASSAIVFREEETDASSAGESKDSCTK